MAPPESTQGDSPRGTWLRRADQLGIAALVLVGLLSIAGYWIAEGGHHGRLIELEKAVHGHLEYEVDVNTATWPELAQLPNIGETLARRIVQQREHDGPYLDHTDLLKVRGIGPKTLEGLKPYLRPIPSRASLAGN